MEQHLTVSPRTFTGVVAGLLLLIGLIFVAIPINTPSLDLPGQTAVCGAAFDRVHYNLDQDAVACSSLRSTRLAWTLPLMGLGLVALAGVGLVYLRSSERDDAPAGEKAA